MGYRYKQMYTRKQVCGCMDLYNAINNTLLVFKEFTPQIPEDIVITAFNKLSVDINKLRDCGISLDDILDIQQALNEAYNSVGTKEYDYYINRTINVLSEKVNKCTML